MTNLTRRATVGLSAVAAFALGAAPAALAQTTPNTAKLAKAGDTQVKLNSATKKALKSAGVKVAPTSPAKVKSGAVSFPISSGTLDPQLKDGASITHSGGLRFSKGSKKLTLQSFRIRITGASATISARVGGASATVFTLDLRKAKISGRNPITNWKGSGIGVKLNKTSANALNKTFGGKSFKSGATIGTATVNARLAELIIVGGQTSVTLDGGTLGLVTGAGIVPGVVAPTTLTGTVATFPVTKTKIAANLASGVIPHTGGLTLTKGATTIKLTNFDINLASGTLAAAVNDAATKTPVLDLDVTNVTQSAAQPLLVKGVGLKLNAAAAGALGGLGATVPPGTPFGTAEVSLNIR